MSRSIHKHKSKHICAKNFGFRLYDNELQNFEKQVAAANCTYSKYIRHCILNKPIIRIDGLPDITIQLIRIGNNLNQLTRAFNTYGTLPSSNELLQIQNDITVMKDKLLYIRR